MLITLVYFQVLNSAWERGLPVAGENALPCFDREGYMSIVELAKPRNDPDRRHFSFFVYQQLTPFGKICFSDLDYFIKSMHGKDSYGTILFVHKYFIGLGQTMTPVVPLYVPSHHFLSYLWNCDRF